MLRVKRAKQNSYRTIILGVFFILSSVRSVQFNHPKIQTVFVFLIHCFQSKKKKRSRENLPNRFSHVQLFATPEL